MKKVALLFILFSLVVTIYGKLTDKCWSHSDCDRRECCAGTSWKKPGACAHQPQQGHKCHPWLHPSTKTHCPCVRGTTCTEYYDKHFDRMKFKCMKFVPHEVEIEVNSPRDY